MPSPRHARRFAQPYPAREALLWIFKNLAGPPRQPIPFDPLGPDVVLNAITPRLTLAFLGDILPTRRVSFAVDPEVQAFVRGVDWLVGNLEGPVVSRRVPWVFMGQAHTPDILDLLETLAPPERTVLLCANNHAADYGPEIHQASRALLRRHGILCPGDRSQPTVGLTAPVALTAGTAWSNHEQEFLAPLPAAPPAHHGFRILCPHWGYELETVPRQCQITQGARWLREWDLIVGHHSHTPQPVTADAVGRQRRAIAYSLGNFTFGYDLPHHRRGLMLRVEVGPTPDGAWAVGRLQWIAIVLRFAHRRRATVAPADAH
jgi:hypothetical protein